MPSPKPITVNISSDKSISIDVPTALRHHQIKLKTFLSRYKQYTNLVFAIFIFHPPEPNLIPPPPLFDFITKKGIASNSVSHTPIEPARLLLLQRNHADTSFPDLWEVPRGSSELTDPTILHSAAQDTFGDGEELETSEATDFMLNFEIEVEELLNVGKIVECAGLGDVHIKLDPNEHQEFVWATEQDINDEIYPLVIPQQKAVILQAFQLRKEDEERARALAVSKSKGA